MSFDPELYTPQLGQFTVAQRDAFFRMIQNRDTAGNLASYDALLAALDKKQNALTFDATPTENSANPVTSGGVYAALSAKTSGSGINLLDNWYFAGGGSQQGGGQFPINQRGETSYSGGGYTIDRWAQIGATQAVLILPTGVQISNGGQLFQYFEPSRMTVGRTYTMSAIVDGVCYFTTFTYTGATDETHFIPAGNCIFVFYYNLFDAGNNAIGWNAVTADITIAAVKLELGDTQTLAHRDASGNWALNDPPPNYQQELAKCQRYFLRINTMNGGFVMNGIVSRALSGATGAKFLVPTPVEMRIAPTVSGMDKAGWYATSSGQEGWDMTFKVEHKAGTGIVLRGTPSADFNANNMTIAWFGSEFPMDFSADL